MSQEPAEFDDWLQAALGGDTLALDKLFESHRERIRRSIALRMDRRMRGRVDPSDVIQDTFLDASRRLEAYAAKPELPFFVWLRFLAQQRLIDLHRVHLGAAMRSVDRELPIGFLEACDESMAQALTSQLTSASQVAMRTELQTRVQSALAAMPHLDREILVLRHYELLSNAECATVLDLSKTAASNRYVRALMKLKELLGQDMWKLFE